MSFKSGVSAGAGLTVKLQREVKGSTEFIDTPGLFDAARIEEAAKKDVESRNHSSWAVCTR